MLPESFGGRIIYLLQQYGPSFLKGAGVSMWLALVGTLLDVSLVFWLVSCRRSRWTKMIQQPKSNYQSCQIYYGLLCGVLSWDSNDGPGNVYLFWKCLSI